MGYSMSMVTVENNYHWLRDLESMQPLAWECSDGRPDKFAYKLHECLSVAVRYADRYPLLARAAEHYRIRVRGNTVLAEPRGERVPKRIDAGAIVKDTRTAAPAGSRPQYVTVPVTTAKECELFWRQKQLPCVIFEQHNLSEPEIQQLNNWATAENLVIETDSLGLSIMIPGMATPSTPTTQAPAPAKQQLTGFALVEQLTRRQQQVTAEPEPTEEEVAAFMREQEEINNAGD